MGKQLPVQLTPFIGREREIADVKRLLEQARLVTLTGPGGSGKSRLAVEVARQLDEIFQGEHYWVDLAPIDDASLVPKVVAAALAAPEQPDRPVVAALVDFLADRQLVLILDNCEHLVAACAQLADRLLQACPALRILATSREPLALAGESVYPVPALALPDPRLVATLRAPESISAATLTDLAASEAIELFLQRAAAVVPGFTLSPENAAAIADICIRLDGLPLALELAAARVNVLTADQIADRLEDRFTLLRASARGGIAQRHQSLRAAIDWSYELLAPPEQAVLQRLSVFAGGCTLATAEAVCAGDGVTRESLLPLLSSLVDKSFVAAETLGRGVARYRLLETIRQYAREKLAETGEWPACRDRHLHCFVRLTEEAEPKLEGAYQQLWLNALEDEYDNIRAALAWALASAQIEAGLRITVALYLFWTIRDYVEEGLNWHEQLLAQANGAVSPAIRAEALAHASVMAGRRGRPEAQTGYGDDAIFYGEEAGAAGREALAWALGAQGWIAQKRGDHATALAYGLREIELLREVGEPPMLGLALSLNSFTAMSLGRFDQARAMLDEALPLLRASGNPYRIAMALNFSGDLARCEKDYARARSAYKESVTMLRELDAARDLASALHNLGHVYVHQGDVEEARTLFEESMSIHQEQQNRSGMAECLLGFAALAIAAGSPSAAARTLAAAAAIGGTHITSEWAATVMEYEHYLARARAALTPSAFRREQEAGQAMTLEQAVAAAQEAAEQAAATEVATRKLDALTPREREVAALIAQARSNGEIAEELVVSKRTVETHVSNIRAKLGATSRTQIVRWAIQSGLVDPPDSAQTKTP